MRQYVNDIKCYFSSNRSINEIAGPKTGPFLGTPGHSTLVSERPHRSDSKSAIADIPNQNDVSSVQPENEQPTQTEEPSPWQFTQEAQSANNYSPSDIPAVQWTASEFIDNEKTSGWFMSLAGITALAVVVIFLITRDLVTSFVIIIAAVLFAVTARRKPRTLQYQIDNGGINIGGKFYPYELFKSFAILAEGAFNSIQLMPLKRFMPPISLYFPPDSEEQIIMTLGSYLPHEERTHDPIERLMRRVRF